MTTDEILALTRSDVASRPLRRAGWEVRTAANGREALEALEEITPNAILLDLMMPEMDGFEFLEELRRHEAWSTIPVLVVTAKALDAEERSFRDGRMARVVQKGSASPKDLSAEVMRLARPG